MQEDQHTISGNVFLINGGAVSWFSKRQELVLLSITESEYIALTHTAKEAIWLLKLIKQVFGIDLALIDLRSNNQSAIALANDNTYHAQTKHLDICYHFICWLCRQNRIKITYCLTSDMVADALMKLLLSLKVKHFALSFGLHTT